MKNFFGALLGSFIGILIVGLLGVVIIIAMVGSKFSGMAEQGNEIKSMTENTVLHIKLDQTILERSQNNPFAAFTGEKNTDAGLEGLNTIIKSIKKAKLDSRVKGIYLEIGSNFMSSLAHIEEMRNALIDFKQSGKFIYSSSIVYPQGGYYLATVSDKIYMAEGGLLLWKGLKAEIQMLKGFLDKAKINMQVNRHGKYKSAVEPYMYEHMSAESRFQLKELLSHAWGHMLTEVSKARNIDAKSLNGYADSLSAIGDEAALQRKMIDVLGYPSDVENDIANKLKLEDSGKLNLLTVSDYKNKSLKKEDGEMAKTDTKNKIAVIYADGTIIDGDGGDDGVISDENMHEAIEKIKKDDAIKAVVLRINSPGGSAFASDIMYKELKALDKIKPIVVSMANYAASGGYYIACGGRYIYAEPNTITGSIGVFQTIPDVSKALKEYLGINNDTVLTNKNSDFISVARPLSGTEKNVLQGFVDKTYHSFISIVAQSRKLTVAEVDSIAQGRVWLGSDALKNRLVDEMGGIEMAKAKAAQLAKIGTDYKIVEYPKRENPLAKIFGGNAEVKVSIAELSGLNDLLDTKSLLIMNKLFKKEMVLTWMPYELKID
jgi:protease IV